MRKRNWMMAAAVALGMMMAAQPAIAEQADDDEVMQELYGDTQTAAAGSVELVGDEVYLNEMRSIPDTYMLAVRSAEFTDEVTAMEPAEDSMKIKASAGNICLDVKLVYRHGKDIDSGVVIEPIFTCGINVGGNTDYKGRLLIEAASNDGNNSWHFEDPQCLATNTNAYLVNVENSVVPAFVGSRYDSQNSYFLYDYVVQIPQEYATDSTPIYVTIDCGEAQAQFYYQVK